MIINSTDGERVVLCSAEQTNGRRAALARIHASSTTPLSRRVRTLAGTLFTVLVLLSCSSCGLAGHSYDQDPTTGSTESVQEKASGEKANGKSEAVKDQDVLVSLGVNANRKLIESSGVGTCTFVEDSIWTHNDSGHSSHIFLLKTDGTLVAKVELLNARNTDWESMCRFELDGVSYLMVGDVGDNFARRKSCQLYLIKEPDLSSKLALKTGKEPIETSVRATRMEFTYPDGAKDCEAIAVDVLGKQIWLVEKVHLNTRPQNTPGIYALPLSLKPLDKPMVAKRIADFSPRNVTGMDFSPDGRWLIIRNYFDADLFSRIDDESWEEVIEKTESTVVVLPFQRQGEAVCFAKDSKSIILTSEVIRQPIWQVKLKSDFEQPRKIKKKK